MSGANNVNKIFVFLFYTFGYQCTMIRGDDKSLGDPVSVEGDENHRRQKELLSGVCLGNIH